jgi:hypothetical protein
MNSIVGSLVCSHQSDPSSTTVLGVEARQNSLAGDERPKEGKWKREIVFREMNEKG